MLGTAAAEVVPPGFDRRKASVGDVGIDYVVGGDGPTVVLLHGYPQSWHEWRHVAPALAERFTVIAPSLRGAGLSDAPPGGYDKKTMAGDIHGLLTQLGRDRDVRLVGHDIGTMVAYAYAAAHPGDVKQLVLSEAPIPDPVIYTFPALTAQGPGGWHFGFFALSNGMPEEMIAGRERTWVSKFVDALEVVKGSVTDEDVSIYASYLSEPARLNALLAWFRSFPQDMLDTKEFQKKKLPMPVLAIGAQGSLGDFVPNQVREYANDVTGLVIPDSGHWLYEERPAEMVNALLEFFEAGG